MSSLRFSDLEKALEAHRRAWVDNAQGIAERVMMLLDESGVGDLVRWHCWRYTPGLPAHEPAPTEPPPPDGMTLPEPVDLPPPAVTIRKRAKRRTSEKACSVDGCDRKAACKGWCKMHYDRHVRGTPLDAPVRAKAGTKAKRKRGRRSTAGVPQRGTVMDQWRAKQVAPILEHPPGSKERKKALREIASRELKLPDGTRHQYGAWTIMQWAKRVKKAR